MLKRCNIFLARLLRRNERLRDLIEFNDDLGFFNALQQQIALWSFSFWTLIGVVTKERDKLIVFS